MNEKMKTLGKILLVLVVIAAGAIGASAEAGEKLFVSPEGSDNDPGTKGKPFKSLERARQQIRALRRDELLTNGATVWLRAGTYLRDRTFSLTEEDSGTETAPIVYRAYPGEEVHLTGGQEVTGFKPVTDPAILARLDEAARSKVMETDLKAQGITDFGKVADVGWLASSGQRLELFFNDKPMTLARWPNDGFTRIADVTPEQPHATHGHPGSRVGKFVYEGDRPARWSGERDIWVHGYWFWDWADSCQRVESIDTEQRLISLEPPYHGFGYRKGQRFYAFNILAELDMPGEWYLDRSTGKLYFWPPEPIETSTAVVSLLEEPLVRLRNASHVTLQDLTFEGCRGDAVVIEWSSQNRVAGCTLRNIGAGAVIVSGGRSNGVVGCDIYQVGAGGITLHGGNRRTLEAAGHYAVNNHIWDYGRLMRTYAPAVAIWGVGNRVAHNLIHHGPHSGITLKGNEHVIEFNEIHHVALETGDVGAFYMGRDWTERGNVIRYNYFHHIGVVGRGSMAVYLDDSASGTTIFGNLFYQTRYAVLIGGGRDNLVANNIFVDCQLAVHVDARGLGWASKAVTGVLADRLQNVPYQHPPWSEKYPQLVNILNDEPAIPKGNRIVHNVCSRGPWLAFPDGNEDWVTLKDNWTEGDPGFVAPEEENFQLRDDSPAYQLGFQRIPMERIGLVRDDYRTDLPTDEPSN